MRGGSAVLAGGLALVVFAGIAVGAGSPIVSAGLDQDVVLGDTVYLDGGGTHVPDGDLAELEWSIETPNGSTASPDCVDCETTSFEPSQIGQYAVTLTAESEAGVERSDTLYVSVSQPVATDGSSASGGSGAADGNGCFISYEGGGDHAINQAICDHTGVVLGVEVSDDGDAIESYVLEMTGDLLHAYDGIAYAGDGRYRIPADSLHHQSEIIWESHKEGRAPFNIEQPTIVPLSRSSESPTESTSEACHPRVPSYYC